MDLTVGKLGRVARVGQVLAFLGALFLAVNPHPIHAQYDEAADHSHLGTLCEPLDAKTSSSDGKNGMPNSHGDCVHHFDPIARASIEQIPSDLSVPTAAIYVSPLRQRSFSSDPPPPRYPS